MALLIDPLLSDSISKLLEIVIFVAQTTANFKSELGQLQNTLNRITPIIKGVLNLNRKLDRTESESQMFILEIQEAEKLVRKCLKIKGNLVKKFTHSLKLKDVNNKLLRFFQLEVQAVQARDIKQALVEFNDVHEKLDSLSIVRDLGQTFSSNSMSISYGRYQTGEFELDRGSLGWQVPNLPSGIVAFDEPLKKLRDKILAPADDDRDEGFDYGSVVVVAAAGGCGKTTLVTKLCYDPAIQEKFAEKIFFVTVSETPNFMVIVNNLFNPSSFGQPIPFQSDEDAKHQLGNFLQDKISSPVLIVLDDVWSDSFIENFQLKIKGCKILVTSRTAFPKYEVFNFDPLNDEDATTLFKRSAFTESKKRPQAAIDDGLVYQMVKRCKNHPLTLSVVGSLLNGRDESAWKSMLKSLSQGSSVLDMNLRVRERLERSFNILDEEFKEYFLDFGLFPEDHYIPAAALLDMWVHLYDHDDEGSQTFDKIVGLSFRHLVNLISTGLMELSNTFNYCTHQFVKQHDLLRELAINLSSRAEVPISQRKRLIINARGEDLPESIIQVQEPMQARILSISTGESFTSRWCNMEVPNVEVVVLNLMSKTYTLPHFLKDMKKMTVLNVTNYGLYPTRLENFHLLGCLSNLLRIRLELVSISSFSTSILALVNLQKVSFIMCKIGNAFANFSNKNFKVWPRLVEIEMDCCQDIVEFPAILCSGVYLKFLNITNCFEMCVLPDEFGNLTNLETLSLRSCTKLEKLPDSITRLEKLNFLDITECLSLKVLPKEMGNLGGLRTIYMKGCTGIHELPSSVRDLLLTEVVCNEEISSQWPENVHVSKVDSHLTSLPQLYELIISVAQTTSDFRPELKDLLDTLDLITPFISHRGELREDANEFIFVISHTEKLVRECLQIQGNFHRKSIHSLKLKKVLTLFQDNLEVQSRNILHALTEIKHLRRSVNVERGTLGWQVPMLPRGTVKFEEPLNKLKSKILACIDGSSVVVVSAASGCGKTTLVTMLCYHPDIRAKYKEVFYVKASATDNLVAIANSLLNVNPYSEQVRFQDEEDAKSKLESFFRDQVSSPILLVLDDVPSDSYVKHFKFNIRGYTLLVTSRMVLPIYDVFELDPLSNKDAKTLLESSASDERMRIPGLTIDDDILNEMVYSCKKNPLILSEVGRYLYGKFELIWKSVLKMLSEIEWDTDNKVVLEGIRKNIEEADMNFDKYRSIFNNLDEKFKQCFLDLGLFPGDRRIPACALLDMWVDLYDHDNLGMDTLTKVFELYHRKLFSSITIGKEANAIVNFCEQIFVAQRYILREVAVHFSSIEPIAQRTRLIIDVQGKYLPASIKQVQTPMQAHMLSISTGDSFSSQWCDMKVPDVEFLVLNISSESYTLPHFLKEMHKLKVVIVTNYGVDPIELGNFHLLGSSTNLTRIRLERVVISHMHISILSLLNLEKISLIMCKIGKSFNKLSSDNPNVWPRLVEFEMDNCEDLDEFPEIFCNCVHLQTLSITNCNNVSELPEDFGRLNSLETLSLRSCGKLEKLSDSITGLPNLTILDISDCSSLCELPEEIGNMGGLRRIYMQGCTRVLDLPNSVRQLSDTEVFCNEEISNIWKKFPNVTIPEVEEDRLLTLFKNLSYSHS